MRCPGASSQVEPGCDAEGGTSAHVAYGGHFRKWVRCREVRFTPVNRHGQLDPSGPESADIVAKVFLG